MGKALLVAIAIVLVVYAIFDVLATPRQQIKVMPKVVWLVLVIIVPFVGPLIWILFGTHRLAPPATGSRPQPPRGPRGPDDDPDYLRGL